MGPTLALALLLTSGLDMRWDAPPACPDEAAVHDRVREFLQSSSANADSVRARVTVTAGKGGWAADLEMTVGELTEHRVLEDPSCDVVATATAFVVAVAIDPQLLMSEPELDSEPEPEPEPVAEDPLPKPAESDPRVKPEVRPDPPRETSDARGDDRPRRPPARVAGAARLSGALDVGASAGAAVGPQVTGSVLLGRWRIEVPVVVLFGRPIGVSAGAVQTTVFAAGVRGCRELGRSALRFPICVGAEGGRFRAQARGFDEVGTATAPWFAPTADVGLHWAFASRFALRAGAGAVLPVLRPRFEVDNVGLVHRAGPVALRAELGIEVRFP